MSDRLSVHDRDGSTVYDIVIESSFSALADELKKLNTEGRRICIVTESTVAPLYSDSVFEIVSKLCRKTCKFVFPAGEANKNLYTVKDLYTFLIENKFDRKDMLIALGGGVVGDLTGYAAATYLRGIDFVQVPTTLLAQSDSSVGGKTGVDFDCYKNMVGAFYQPKLVYMNTATLKSLTDKEYLSGMGEVIKHGLIRNRDYYFWLRENRKKIIERDDETLIYLARMNCTIKRDVVEKDFREQSERAVLNFGHTLGHAIEKFKFETYLHGECVSLGINAASYISYKKGFITGDEYRTILDTLESFGLPVNDENIDIPAILEATKSDKKMEAGIIKFVVLKEIGRADIDRSVSTYEMEQALKAVTGCSRDL